MFLSSLLSTTYAVEVFEPIALWLTVGILAALLIAGVVVFFAKPKAFGKYAKYALLGAFAYLLVLAIVFFALEIAKKYSGSYAEKNWLDRANLIRFVFIPLLVLSCVSLVGLTAYTLTAKFAPKAKKTVGIFGVCVCVLSLIAALVCVAVYYNKSIKDGGYYNSDTASVEQIALYLSAILAIALIVGLTFFDKQKFAFNSRSLTYAGICVAMSFALSYIKLWDLPSGGSVTLVSLLPLMIYAYIFGAKKGVFVGLVYGVLQAVQDPWIIHPAQFMLDYPIVFSAIGLAGLFGKLPKLEKLPQVKFTIGAVLAGTLRFACHVLSGVFAFSANAEGNVWLFSLAYNSFVFIDIALVIVAGVFVLCSKSFVRAIEKINVENGATAEVTPDANPQ